MESFSFENGEPNEGFWNPILNRVKTDSIDLDELFAHLNAKDRIIDDTTLITVVKD
jgi:hypothetical protein